jgi:hypothetical protein
MTRTSIILRSMRKKLLATVLCIVLTKRDLMSSPRAIVWSFGKQATEGG